ncbi:MAG TPA: AraC family transcriptional regulator [Polyangiaceae bacterium]|jgi:AraC-like DNA-binding protein|nr:AraC family transcriptional regulator [Polyangiaceae bacterium]
MAPERNRGGSATNFGERAANEMGVVSAPTLVVQPLHKSAVAFTRLTCDRPDIAVTTQGPAEDAFVISLQLRAASCHQLWLEGRPIPVQPGRVGEMRLLDLNQALTSHVDKPFDILLFYIPRAALDALADEREAPRSESLRVTPGASIDDPVIRHLGAALMPGLGIPEQVNRLFVDHLALATLAHVGKRYGTTPLLDDRPRGGLGAAQVRRAKELLMTHLDGDLSLDDLARECGLSRSHFARAFKTTTGQPAHRWLVDRRIERAQELLLNSALSLSQVAKLCGFTDQSHFTRVFAARVGAGPGRWRRIRR